MSNETNPDKLSVLEIIGYTLFYILLSPFILVFGIIFIVFCILFVLVDLLAYPFYALVMYIQDNKRTKKYSKVQISANTYKKEISDDAQ